eukprot:664551-Pleurochrysis_carterae.AAC.1
MELPGLGKFWGTIERPQLTHVLLLAARHSKHMSPLSVPKAQRVVPRLLVTARLGRLGHRTRLPIARERAGSAGVCLLG